MILEDLFDLSAIQPPIDPAATGLRKAWLDNGYVIVHDLLPEAIVDAYCAVREKANGWEKLATPYMVVPELKELCCCPEVARVMQELLGEPAGVHLNLCGWKSTERNWHQDFYLNPKHANNNGVYVAAWCALETISPDAGPFQYLPGSHRWGITTLEKTIEAMRAAKVIDTADSDWPKHSERILNNLFADYLDRHRIGEDAIHEFIGGKGDVLFWSPYLWHRGSKPKNPDLLRKSIIFHASGIHHRKDMAPAVQHNQAGWYFPIKTSLAHPDGVIR